MTGSVISQSWAMIDDTNRAIRREQSRHKEGSERIAEENSSTKNVSGLQQLEKDVVLRADPNTKQLAVNATKTGGSDKPALPDPEIDWNALQGVGHGPGLISIIGAVLCLQAKSNSNFWSTLWKQASQSMMMEVKFAPIIGNAIKSQYDAQSAATQSQSDQAKNEGGISLAMFGVGCAMAAYSEFKDPENPLNQDEDSITSKDETMTPKTDAEATATERTNQQTDKLVSENDKSWADRAKRVGKWILDKGKAGQKRFSNLLTKGSQQIMMMQMLSDGTTKFFVTSKYQAQQALYQSQEGGSAAVSKEAEQYSQFYGQDFSRSEDLRQGSQQLLDYGMNILKSTADSITQTSTSMFRG